VSDVGLTQEEVAQATGVCTFTVRSHAGLLLESMVGSARFNVEQSRYRILKRTNSFSPYSATKITRGLSLKQLIKLMCDWNQLLKTGYVEEGGEP